MSGNRAMETRRGGGANETKRLTSSVDVRRNVYGAFLKADKLAKVRGVVEVETLLHTAGTDVSCRAREVRSSDSFWA